MRRVLIIGANRGIGLALAKIFKEQDFHVIATCRKSSSELANLSVEVLENISMKENTSILSLKEKVSSFDYLVHNAGLMHENSLETLTDTFDFSSIEEQFFVNSIAPLKTATALIPQINKGGKIIFISSRMGSIADNSSGGSYGYRASKCALNMFAKSLSVDLRERDISVATLHPGWVKTRMTGNNGLIGVEESAKGLFKRIDSLSQKTTGGFWHTNGETLNW